MAGGHAIVLFTHSNIDFRPTLICAARDARKIPSCRIVVSGFEGDHIKLGGYAQEVSNTFGVNITYHELSIPPEIVSKKAYKLNLEARSLKQSGLNTMTCVDNDILFSEGTIAGQLEEFNSVGPDSVVGPRFIRHVPPESTKFFAEYAAQNNIAALESFPEKESASFFHKAMKGFVENVMRRDLRNYLFQPPHMSGTMMTVGLESLPHIPPEVFCDDAFFSAYYFPNVRYSGKVYHPELVRYSWSKNPIFEYESVVRSYLRFSQGSVRKFLSYIDHFEKHSPGSKHATISDWVLFLSILALGYIKHDLLKTNVLRSYQPKK